MSRAWQAGGFDVVGLLPLLLVLVAVLGPLLFVRRSAPPEPFDDDFGGGGPPGPPAPPPPHRPPGGGVPLPNAVQARVRLRGHERLADGLPRPPRRSVREPDRVRTPSARRQPAR